jgi:hypothetical protein
MCTAQVACTTKNGILGRNSEYSYVRRAYCNETLNLRSSYARIKILFNSPKREAFRCHSLLILATNRQKKKNKSSCDGLIRLQEIPSNILVFIVSGIILYLLATGPNP